MKFGMISLRENGDRIETANETPAFFALTINGVIFDYFGTIEALHLALESIQAEQISECETTAFDLKLAA